jgi:DMSO/TMAO reductase YedYZ molybdopterin-dependent catalytic subunit
MVGRLARADQDRIDEQLEEMQNEISRFRLELQLGNGDGEVVGAARGTATRTFSLHDLQSLPKNDRISTVGCPQSTSRPTTTSLFGGVLMKDLLRIVAGIVQEEEDVPSSSSPSSSYVPAVVVQRLVFHAMDGETVTVQMTTTTDDYSNYQDILVAYEENGAPLTHQRGFPLRVIIPRGERGGGRVVKWVKRIEIQYTPQV